MAAKKKSTFAKAQAALFRALKDMENALVASAFKPTKAKKAKKKTAKKKAAKKAKKRTTRKARRRPAPFYIPESGIG